MSKRIESVFEFFDDESTREKCTVMSKWEAVIDDARNDITSEEELEDFLEPGKRYRFIIEEIES